MAVLRPSLDELDDLAEPLNDGALRVAHALACLDDEWTVYVQPRLALDVPDFVVVHPRHGVCAIEVKDWSSGTRYRQDERGVIEYRGRDGAWRCSAETPRYQAYRYSQVIFDQFFALPEHDTASSPVIRAALILPRHTTEQARRLLELTQVTPEEHAVEVWGGDALATGIERVVRGVGCPPPPAMSIERLRRHLSESELIREWRGSRPLSAGARNIETNPRDAKIRRVRGPAGSGKSFGLAARAARLASTGQSVAVLTCNVTLSHYLRAHVTRRCHEYAADPTLVTVVDFYGLCQRVADDARQAGVEPVACEAPWSERIVAQAANAYAHGQGPVFDAVLVDEGQDFTLEWWNLLRDHVCKPGGEMLLVSDPTQDLYDKRAWVEEDSMAGAGFSGPWAELEGSYRIPDDLVPIANEFSLRYLDGERLAVSVPDDRQCVSGSRRAERAAVVERVTDGEPRSSDRLRGRRAARSRSHAVAGRGGVPVRDARRGSAGREGDRSVWDRGPPRVRRRPPRAGPAQAAVLGGRPGRQGMHRAELQGLGGAGAGDGDRHVAGRAAPDVHGDDAAEGRPSRTPGLHLGRQRRPEHGAIRRVLRAPCRRVARPAAKTRTA